MSYTVVSGTFTGPGEVASAMYSFLATSGWSLVRTVADGAIKDRIYKSVARVPDLYVQTVSSGSSLYHTMYGSYSSSGIEQGLLGGPLYTNLGASYTGNYWLVGDSSFAWLITGVSGSFYSSYVGYLDSFLSSSLSGLHGAALVWNGAQGQKFSDSRVAMYTSSSGIVACSAVDMETLYGDGVIVSDGSNSFFGAPVVVKDTTYRGTLLGIVQVKEDSALTSGEAVPIGCSGDNYLYISHSGTNNTFFYGPINA